MSATSIQWYKARPSRQNERFITVTTRKDRRMGGLVLYITSGWRIHTYPILGSASNCSDDGGEDNFRDINQEKNGENQL